jgi:uroporphyrin-III C-methyltransferase
MPQNDLIAAGDVWLVGAGPGDPDLLTRKAERLIRAADIVFYDALVGPGVLDLVPGGVEMVNVGKRSGRHSKAQGSINDLLLEAARAGKRVVRLKGGDPSMFGRSAEEMSHLAAHGIATHICPGITAASAAVAGAGVSLTLRGLARSVRFMTAHVRAGEPIELDWAALADPDATLAIYMGRAAAPQIARALIDHGMAADVPTLIAVNVSLPGERYLFTRLDRMAAMVPVVAGDEPAVLLIGEAVRESMNRGGRDAADMAAGYMHDMCQAGDIGATVSR